MIKQVAVLSLFFTLCMAVNVAAIDELNDMSQRNKKIHVILDEIDLIAATPINEESASDSAVLGETTIQKDPRVAYTKQFLRKHDSVLYDHAEYIVEMADKYQIDYRLIPAIAMQESNLCRVIPVNSYNCWGWGIYGGKVTRFTSYPEAIETVSRGLKTGYVDQGLTTPDQIMQKYTPSSPNGAWARGVNFFFGAIE
jgi:hypothetical protein